MTPTPRDRLLAVWRRHLEGRLGPLVTRLDVSTGSRLHRADAPPVGVAVYGVYRRRNVATVTDLVAGLAAGSVHLHALDEVDPGLADRTRGHGPGDRVPLLRALVEAHPPAPGDWVVTVDDDVTFAGAGLERFVALAAAGGLDVAGPAHLPVSHHSYRVTRVVPLSTARETRFVEVGPVVAFSPRAAERVLPFPSDARMGWGLDVSWTLEAEGALRFGVVDATPVVHHGAVGAAYDQAAEEAYQRRHLDAAGVASAHDLARNTGRTWRPWQRRPRWVGAAS